MRNKYEEMMGDPSFVTFMEGIINQANYVVATMKVGSTWPVHLVLAYAFEAGRMAERFTPPVAEKTLGEDDEN